LWVVLVQVSWVQGIILSVEGRAGLGGPAQGALLRAPLEPHLGGPISAPLRAGLEALLHAQWEPCVGVGLSAGPKISRDSSETK